MKRALKIFGIVAVALWMTGCEQGLTDDLVTDGMVQLTDDELEATLRGTSLRELGPVSGASSFSCAGEWTKSGANNPNLGRYEIREDQVCIKVLNRENCFRLLRAPDGKIFRQDPYGHPFEVTFGTFKETCR